MQTVEPIPSESLQASFQADLLTILYGQISAAQDTLNVLIDRNNVHDPLAIHEHLRVIRDRLQSAAADTALIRP